MINTKEEYKCYLELIGNRFNNPNIQWDKWYNQFSRSIGLFRFNYSKGNQYYCIKFGC